MDLIIDKEQNVISLTDFPKGYYCMGTINNAFGNILLVLNDEFTIEEVQYNSPEYIVNSTIEKLVGKSNDKNIYGFSVGKSTMYFIYDFLNDKDKLTFTLQDVEKIRIENHFSTAFFPISNVNLERGVYFPNVKSINEMIYCILYYYAFNGLKLAKCEHCGKWFAVESLKEKYCSRKSTFPEYEKYSCKEAVKRIKDMLEKKRISEYERLRVRANEYGLSSKHNIIFNDFCKNCDDYKEKIKKGASIELLKEYKDFLFDSENVRPKYQRIKNY